MQAGTEQKILVFDLGGGTLDVTIMDMFQTEEHGSGFEVLSTSGDTQLGGTDMDNTLMAYIVAEFKKESGIDVSQDKMAEQRVREAAEKAKIELSSAMTTDINLPFITADDSGPKHLTMQISRAKLEELISTIIDRCKHPVEQAIADAKGVASASDIDRVILVGGPTRIPAVQAFVEGIVGKKLERGVDPMECVSMGAAIQAAALTGDIKDIQLLDVTPLSLGIETMGGVFTRLIERNTTIPTRKTETFSTAEDNQPAVTLRVLQGERSMSADNTELGRFDLTGIPPAPRGVPKIEVTFDIDANGIVQVHAKDSGTGKEQSIRITAPTKLEPDEIDKMVKDAEQFAEADKQKKKSVEAKNQAETLAYSTEKSLKEYGDKIDEAEKKTIEGKIMELREVLKSDDLEKIKSASESLMQAAHKLAEEVYKAAQAAQAETAGATAGAERQPGGDAGGKQPEDVVDADFTASDDKK
jgi:molecular chaperone DnaK